MKEGASPLDWPLPFDEVARLDVELDTEEVALVGVDPGVAPHVSVFGCEDDNRLHLDVERLEGTTFVRITYPGGGEGWRSSHAHHVLLHVPRSVTARVRSWSGRVHASSLEGCDLSLDTRAGEIVVRKVSGVLRLTSSAGRIDAREISGSVRVETAVGAVRLELIDLDAGAHLVRSNAGAVHVGVARGMPVRIDARSNLGHVAVHVPTVEEARATLEVATHLGAIHVEPTAHAWLPRLAGDPYRM